MLACGNVVKLGVKLPLCCHWTVGSFLSTVKINDGFDIIEKVVYKDNGCGIKLSKNVTGLSFYEYRRFVSVFLSSVKI